MDNRFQNAKIYKIVDVGYNKCYIGSTCEELSRRMAHHREGFKKLLRDGKTDTRTYDIFNDLDVSNNSYYK